MPFGSPPSSSSDPEDRPFEPNEPSDQERWVPSNAPPGQGGMPLGGPDPRPDRIPEGTPLRTRGSGGLAVLNWFSRDPQVRHGRMPFDTSNGMHWVAGIVMWGAVAFLAFSTLMAGVDYLMGGDLSGAMEITAGLIVLNGVLLLVLLGVPPLVWVAGFYQGGARAWAHGLFLRFPRPFVHALLGVAAAGGMLFLSILVIYLLGLVGFDADNPMVEDLAEFITWPLVFWIALSAAVGEELFFRGFLQPRIGIVASAVLFGFLHLSYGVALQVIMPLLFGFLLSFLVVFTRSLWPAIVAHFAYNFSVGALLIVGREMGEFDLSRVAFSLFF